MNNCRDNGRKTKGTEKARITLPVAKYRVECGQMISLSVNDTPILVLKIINILTERNWCCLKKVNPGNMKEKDKSLFNTHSH